MKPIIVSAFPATGKSYVTEHQSEFGIKALDSDSSNFSWKMEEHALPDFGDGCQYEKIKVRDPDFPNNYIRHIKECLDSDYDIIFVSSHKDVRKAMTKAGLEYVLMYPELECKEEYIGRCWEREQKGNNGFPVHVMADNWIDWIMSCYLDSDLDNVKTIEMKHWKHISDYIPLIRSLDRVENLNSKDVSL